MAFVGLGLWQLDRHDQRAQRNATIEARAERARLEEAAEAVAALVRELGGEPEVTVGTT